MKTISVIGLTIVLFFACSPPVGSGFTSTIGNIHYGAGGGVTGKTEDNYIAPGGAVYSKEKYIRTLTAEDYKSVLTTAERLKPDTLNDPGNMYYYIRFEQNGIAYRYTWSNKTVIQPELKSWYDQLMTFTKKSE